jgi:integral membrane sensor domain MASE1
MAIAGNGGRKLAARQGILSTIVYALEIAIVTVVYVGFANTALLFPAITAIETPLWPPTGVALALILLRGYRLWPAIFIGSFSANVISAGALTAHPPAIAIGTTLAALVGARLINVWSHGTKTFLTPIGIAKFVLVAFVPTAVVSAAGTSAGQLLAGVSNYFSLAVTAATWSLADAVGTLVSAPVIVLWATSPLPGSAKPNLFETTAIVIAAAAIGVISFIPVPIGAVGGGLLPQQGPSGFLILLPLMWAVMRGNQRAAATAAFVFCGLATWSTTDVRDSIGTAGLNGSLFLLLALSIGTSVVPLLLSAVIAGYRDKQNYILAEQSRLNLNFQETQAALKTVKRRFQIFVESVSDYAIFVLDSSGQVASSKSHRLFERRNRRQAFQHLVSTRRTPRRRAKPRA